VSARAFVVTFAEILAQGSASLRPIDYDNNSKKASIEREVKKLRGRAKSLTVRADKLEAQANSLTPNRTYSVE
jgi:hypothetical protein